MSDLKISRIKTVVGRRTILHLSGKWNESLEDRFRSNDCDGVEWYIPKGRTPDLEPLAALADRLVFLRLRSTRTVDDSVLSRLPRLRYLDATTRGKSPLNLSPATGLSTLMLDDREGFASVHKSSLSMVELYYNTKDLEFFSGSQSLAALTLESPTDKRVNLSADLPGLQRLSLRKGIVESTSGLRAPQLRFLSFDGVNGGELDLVGLEDCDNLEQVSLIPRGPLTVKNFHPLANRPGLRLLKNENVTLA